MFEDHHITDMIRRGIESWRGDRPRVSQSKWVTPPPVRRVPTLALSIGGVAAVMLLGLAAVPSVRSTIGARVAAEMGTVPSPSPEPTAASGVEPAATPRSESTPRPHQEPTPTHHSTPTPAPVRHPEETRRPEPSTSPRSEHRSPEPTATAPEASRDDSRGHESETSPVPSIR